MCQAELAKRAFKRKSPRNPARKILAQEAFQLSLKNSLARVSLSVPECVKLVRNPSIVYRVNCLFVCLSACRFWEITKPISKSCLVTVMPKIAWHARKGLSMRPNGCSKNAPPNFMLMPLIYFCVQHAAQMHIRGETSTRTSIECWWQARNMQRPISMQRKTPRGGLGLITRFRSSAVVVPKLL